MDGRGPLDGVAKTFDTIDEYIGSFPPEVQPVLEQVRETIHEAVPAAEEAISYGMPTFRLDGRYLVYFGGWKQHVGVYPLPEVEGEDERRLAPYLAGKGTARFPLGEPMPLDLIARLVALLLAQRGDGAASG
jgi:uncharacterized protein YdhG (YjbR/CyaY superfamily)